MSVHPEAAALLARFEAARSQPLHRLGVVAARQAMFEARRMQGDREEVAAVTDLLVDGPAGRIPVRCYRPDGAEDRPLVAYFHGGGFVGGGVATSDRWCRSLAVASGCEVASVGYRLAPETAAPGALDDACAAVLALVGRSDRLVVSGDSAGGGLAAGVAIRSRDRGGPAIAGQVLLYPALDADASGRDGEEAMLSRADMDWFWDLYLGRARPAAGGDLVPARADDLSGLPRTLVVTASEDVLRDEALAYGARLAAGGGDVTVVEGEGMLHGFFGQLGVVPSARRYLAEVADFLQNC